jgi:tRNA-dihydrouridine synthase
MSRYYSMLLEHSPEDSKDDSIGKMKQFATYFTHGVRGGAALRASIYQSHDAKHIAELVDQFFTADHEETPNLVLA